VRTIPTIGFLNSASLPAFEHFLNAFRSGLSDTGFVEGKNVAIEYRWADGHYERLPQLAAELASQNVAVIAATGGTVAARAAISATNTIPILFVSTYDPTQVDLVAKFNRPSGNVTGVGLYTAFLAAKRLEALRELLPKSSTIAVLVNPHSLSVDTETKIDREIGDMKAAVRESNIQLCILQAGAEKDFEPAFEEAVRQRADAILITADVYFTSKRFQLVELAGRYALPAAYPWREYVIAGGLMSYGPRLSWAYEQIGHFAGQILKGAKPSELPIQLPTRFEFVINLKTAKNLGLTVPRLTLRRADEVIE
jgi:putative ABC transport system substrate-binding protein